MHCSLSSAIALLLAMFIGCHGSRSSSSSSSLDANRFSFILKTETRPKSGRATAAEAGSEWSPTVQHVGAGGGGGFNGFRQRIIGVK